MNLKLVPCFSFYKDVTYTKEVLKYTYAKTYQYRSRFDEVIRKIIWCSFLPHMVELEL